jgi:hypothetical protein
MLKKAPGFVLASLKPQRTKTVRFGLSLAAALPGSFLTILRFVDLG